MTFSDYTVYVDESGDHSLASINQEHPIFVLAFCVIHKHTYVEKIVPAFQWLKFEFWGHDSVVLHSHEIRKEHGDFLILRDAKIRAAFLPRLNGVIAAAEFMIIAVVIDKKRHAERYIKPLIPMKSRSLSAWSDCSGT
jgi:hypothetical protein